MILRSSRLLLQVFAALAIGTVLLTLAAIWQLAQGPIRLSFLNGFIERALNPEGSGARVTLSETVLAWSGEQRSLDVQALGVELRDRQNSPLARIPELTINFSGRALLRGTIAPRGLVIRGPRLRVSLGGESPVVSGFEEPAPADPSRALGALSQLLQPLDGSGVAGYLTSVEVADGQIAIRDQTRNLAWDITDADIVVSRDIAGIRAEAQLAVTANGITGQVSAVMQHTSLRPEVAVQLQFEDIDPALIASIEPRLDILNRIDLALSGVIDLRTDNVFRPEEVRYDLRAGAGTILLPELYAEPLIMAGAVIRGDIDGDFTTIRVDEAEIDLGGPTASLRGVVRSLGDRLTIALDAEARDVPVDELSILWPSDVGRGARNWVTKNLEAGIVHRATLALTGSAPVADLTALEVDEIGGVMDVSGVTVHYLRPMAPVLDVGGDIRYDAAQFIINTNTGSLLDLAIEDGTVAITLDGPEPVADIDLTVVGPITDALTVLDMEPLRYASTLGIDPAQMGGQHRTNVTFRIPLRAGLSLDDIGVAAASSVTDFSQSSGLFGLPFAAGALSLEVDTTQLSVWGDLSLGDVPVEARWTERFVDDGSFRTRYEVSGIFDQAALASFGLDLRGSVTGAIGVGVSYAIFPDDSAVGATELDLTAADISIPAIGLRKTGGNDARGALNFTVADGALTDISSFEIASDELVATGAVRFAGATDGGGLRQVGLSRLAYGDNELFGTLRLREDGSLDIDLGGQRVDLRDQITAVTDPGDDAETETTPEAGLAYRLSIDPQSPIAEVRVGEITRLLNVSGTLVNDGIEIRSANLRGGLVEPDDFGVVVVDAKPRRSFTIAAADGGALLAALDWTDAVSGGRLLVEGEMLDDEPGASLAGRALMTDFQMIEAPLLGRLLSLASLRGIADTLSGEGITFNRLEVPFEINDDTIELPDVKLRGSQLGILAEGRIDRRDNTISLLGEVAPAYTLNSLLGNIPLIGNAITGGGDGIFAATYKVEGPLDDPKVTVNPLSLLTPGFTRKILGGFGSSAPPPPKEKLEFPSDPTFDN